MSNRNILNHAPLRKLDDQQLLDHTRHLVHAERQLLVLILDFLDEIETRGLALERGYSGLFKYVTGELGYSDGGAWRRIQSMRLCRRVAGVRDKLSSGALTLTTAAQLQTAFERRERARKRELAATRATVPGTASPGSDQRAATPAQDTPQGQDSRAAAAPGGDQPGVDATGDQFVADGWQRNEQPGAVVPAGQEPSVAAPVPAPPLSAPPEHLPLVLAEEDLVAQVAGKSSRAVARIIAEASPEVAVPRDTLRPLGEDRFTLKCTINGECQQGLVQLKGLLSHLDPALSWGTVVARLVQDGIRRYDPRVRGRRSGATTAEPVPGTGGAESLGHPAPRDRESVADCGGTAGSGVAEHPHAGLTSPAKFDSHAPASGSAAPASTQLLPASPAKFDSDAPTNGAAAPASTPLLPVAPTSSAKFDSDAPANGSAAPASAPLLPVAPTSAAKFDSDAPANASAAPASAQLVPVAPTSPAKFDSDAPASSSPASAQLVSVAPTSPAKFDSHAPANGTASPAVAEPTPTADRTPLRQPAPSGRAIPAAVRRALWQRDQARCAYVDPLTGRRCTSQHLLQIDHLQPVARGGGADLTNLRLLCEAHHRRRHRRARSRGAA